MGKPSDAVLAGIPAIQRAGESRARAYETLGAGIGQAALSFAKIPGLLKKKRIEDDYAKVDEAFQAVMVSGKPEDGPKVMGAIIPAITTPEGKKYLSERIGKTYGIKGDLLDLELKKMKVEKEKTAPKRAGLLKRAYDGDDAAIQEIADTGDDAALENAIQARAAGGLLKRSQADQVMQEAKDAKAKADEAAAVKAEADATALIDADPSLKAKPFALLKKLKGAGNSDEAAKAGIVKLAPIYGLDRQAEAAEARDAKGKRDAVIRSRRDRGEAPTEFDEEGNPTAWAPTQSKTQQDELSRLRKNEDDRSAERLRLTKEKAAKGDLTGALADLEQERQGVTAELGAITERTVAGERPAAGYEKRADDLRKKLESLTGEAESLRKMGGGAKAPPAVGGPTPAPSAFEGVSDADLAKRYQGSKDATERKAIETEAEKRRKARPK